MMAAVGQNVDFSGAQRSGNTRRGNGLGRFALRQTRQGEPSEHRVTGVTMKPTRQPERRGHREMARQSERIHTLLRSCPSEQRKTNPLERGAEKPSEGRIPEGRHRLAGARWRSKSVFCPQPQGVAAITGRRLCWLRALLARPLVRI